MMVSKVLPTVVLVPGAFAPLNVFDSFETHLHKAGFPTVIAPLLSAGTENPQNASCGGDAQHIRDIVLLSLIDEGKDVVVFAHSYGGIVGGGAASGLSRATRSYNGQSGGVLGLLYLAGMLLAEGTTLEQASGGQLPPYIQQNTPSPGLSVAQPGGPSQETRAFLTPAPKPAWSEDTFNGRRQYIRTMKDEGFPPAFQEALITQTHVKWTVVDIQAPHEAFISNPGEVLGILESATAGWAEL